MWEEEDNKSRQHSGVVVLPLFTEEIFLARKLELKGNSYRWSVIKLVTREVKMGPAPLQRKLIAFIVNWFSSSEV